MCASHRPILTGDPPSNREIGFVTKKNINGFLGFLAVAKERSFTKAAAQIGISQSALSHTIRQLEARITSYNVCYTKLLRI